jgi:DNA-binding response OmpR family regulator
MAALEPRQRGNSAGQTSTNSRRHSTERDEPLQITSTTLLNHAGYSVIALTTDAEVMKYIALEGRPTINLVLLCHSVPEASRVSLCTALKKSIPNAPILMLYNDYDPSAAEVDGRIENLISPESLLDTVQLLISKPHTTEASED